MTIANWEENNLLRDECIVCRFEAATLIKFHTSSNVESNTSFFCLHNIYFDTVVFKAEAVWPPLLEGLSSLKPTQWVVFFLHQEPPLGWVEPVGIPWLIPAGDHHCSRRCCRRCSVKIVVVKYCDVHMHCDMELHGRFFPRTLQDCLGRSTCTWKLHCQV